MTLFIIGNGFDIAHKLPTNFDPDFKKIALKNEPLSYFWDIYQNKNPDIWSDFENSLAYPNFNALEEIFQGYEPDFDSDFERDRNSVEIQVDLNGLLSNSLYEFASKAEEKLNNLIELRYRNIITPDDFYISLNYTHTLEQLYNVPKENVLHIHGEVGKENLLVGYPEGKFQPEKYVYDASFKDRGSITEIEYQDYLNMMLSDEKLDIYTYRACNDLFHKVKSFSKKTQLNCLINFISNLSFDKIIVIGHSYKIDYEYFEYLSHNYPFVDWMFCYYDIKDKENMNNLIKRLGIKNFEVKNVKDIN